MNIRPVRKDLSAIRRSNFDYCCVIYLRRGGDAVDWSGVQIISQIWNRARTIQYAQFDISGCDLSIGLVQLKLTADGTIPLPTVSVYDVKVIFPDGREEYILNGTIIVSEGYTDD